jgi:hypothetical protein
VSLDRGLRKLVRDNYLGRLATIILAG